MKYCHNKKDCVLLISPLAIFFPVPSVKVEQLLHGLSGKNKDTGERISYIFPQLDFCTLFDVTIKNAWA
jgi:hypothetical protein